MLSARGNAWSKVGFLHGEENLYHPVNNPNGVVTLNMAENWFMKEDMTSYINSHSHFNVQCCTYGEGYTGTLRLRTAMAKHLNAYFRPVQAFDAEEITFAAGVTSINEVCALITCDPDSGDSIMLGSPVYGVFSKDMGMRTGVKLEWVNVGHTDQFTPDCVELYEKGFEEAKARGSNVKALLICNPHNPLGRCYPRETLIGLLKLCAAKGIHLISDEIYALTVHNRDDRPSEAFTSIRAIDYTEIIDPRQVHVLYGMSKDYTAAGLRLGCVISQNTEFSNAIRAGCRFSSPSQLSMEIAAKFLEDQDYVKQFLTKSHREILKSRLLTEQLLTEANVLYSDKGNAAFFLWIDLSPYLPLNEVNGDGWAAEKLLSERFTKAGVLMDTGAEYHTLVPGRFRLMHTVDEVTLREGIRRLRTVLSQKRLVGASSA
ncbi:hypothetical protein ACMFMG_009607 [Clarireedia jacksonii]